MSWVKDRGIRAICFDVDGTFYPKRQMDIRLLRTSILHLPFSLRYNAMRQEIRRRNGLSDPGALDHDAFSELECSIMYPVRPGMLDAFRQREKRLFHDKWEKSFMTIKPYPFLKNALFKAESEGLALGVLSDFPLGSKLKALGIEDFFSYKASTESCGVLKPAKTPFRLMLESMGYKPEEVLYVGDSESKDVKGAKNYGMHACLINKGSRKDSDADIVVLDWKDFADRVL